MAKKITTEDIFDKDFERKLALISEKLREAEKVINDLQELLKMK